MSTKEISESRDEVKTKFGFPQGVELSKHYICKVDPLIHHSATESTTRNTSHANFEPVQIHGPMQFLFLLPLTLFISNKWPENVYCILAITLNSGLSPLSQPHDSKQLLPGGQVKTSRQCLHQHKNLNPFR